MSDDRRPISQRNTSWAQAMTRALVKAKVTPNTISGAGLFFAALGGLCFLATGLATHGGDRIMLFLGGALGCQLRLLCNMLDGMVAVEGGKGSPDGAIWNELPDRFADIFVLVGAGYGVALFGVADIALGWMAAVAAVMTAYVREVARAAGAPADFSGPMAKPHRMFVMTMAALLAALAGATQTEEAQAIILMAGLWIVIVGASVTVLRRTWRAVAFLNRKS